MQVLKLLHHPDRYVHREAFRFADALIQQASTTCPSFVASLSLRDYVELRRLLSSKVTVVNVGKFLHPQLNLHCTRSGGWRGS